MNAWISTFGLVFLAELGDKTQLAVVTQTCKYRRPWPVFLGASLALTAVTGIGAIGGRVLGQWIPPHVLQYVAAAAFVVMGLFIGKEAYQSRPVTMSGHDGISLDTNEPSCAEESTAGRRIGWQALMSTLGLLFVAEMGDKTQLAVLSLAGKSDTPWAVFTGGALALTTVTALGVIGGQGLCKIIPERILLWISAAAFVVMGLLMGTGIL
ncbi:MAG TPA: TMEM165/GDT1 family protein [Chloroflexi bacterium]|nr:TMEM165/GDT1 family protein [Chloroflexota bacterium]